MKVMWSIGMVVLALWAGASASASTRSIWFDRVQLASETADAAHKSIDLLANDCRGLERVLALANSSDDAPEAPLPGRLGKLRTQMVALKMASATVELESGSNRDDAANEAISEIRSIEFDVHEHLTSAVSFCGHGVEKRPQ